MPKQFLYNIVLIAFDATDQYRTNLDFALRDLEDLGMMIKRTAIICSTAMHLNVLDRSYYGATVLHTLYCQQQLEKKLEKLVRRRRLNSLNIITFNNSIIDESAIIQRPVLVDFIQQLQPELFKWR